MTGKIMPTIKDQGDPLAAERLADLEKELNASLPNEYRQFLMHFNGGLPSPDTVDIEGLPGGMTDVQVFFRIGGLVESNDLRWNKVTFSERIPDRMLPVACDSGGNIFCLSLSGTDFGKVIYIDLESQELTQYVVAGNFSRFLEKIREWGE